MSKLEHSGRYGDAKDCLIRYTNLPTAPMMYHSLTYIFYEHNSPFANANR